LNAPPQLKHSYIISTARKSRAGVRRAHLLSRDENPADRRQHREGGLLQRSAHFQQKKI
jgi:hypothetical protein